FVLNDISSRSILCVYNILANGTYIKLKPLLDGKWANNKGYKNYLIDLSVLVPENRVFINNGEIGLKGPEFLNEQLGRTNLSSFLRNINILHIKSLNNKNITKVYP